MDRIPHDARPIIIGKKVDPRKEALIRFDEDKRDEIAVPFICDLIRAASVCDVLRESDRGLGDSPTRVYIQSSPDTPWRKVPGDVVLVFSKGDGTLVLNPEYFPASTTIEQMPYQSLKPKRVL